MSKTIPEFAKELAKKLELEMIGKDPKHKDATMRSLSDIVSRSAKSDSDLTDALGYIAGMDNDLYWKLDDDFKPVRAKRDEGIAALEGDQRIMAKTIWKQGVTVSSVFLAIDHSFKKGSEPILFETMIFDDMGILGDEFKDWQERNSSHEGLISTHFKAVNLIRHKLGEEAMEHFLREKPNAINAEQIASAKAFATALKNL
jgi:hypothetical protein